MIPGILALKMDGLTDVGKTEKEKTLNLPQKVEILFSFFLAQLCQITPDLGVGRGNGSRIVAEKLAGLCSPGTL